MIFNLDECTCQTKYRRPNLLELLQPKKPFLRFPSAWIYRKPSPTKQEKKNLICRKGIVRNI